MTEITIRPAAEKDLEPMTLLFCETVRRVNSADYTPQQIEAWLAKATPARWRELFYSDLHFFIAEQDGSPAGFASIDASGHLHSLFVGAACQRQGVASALLRRTIQHALSHGADHISSEVSVTARPFFEHAGFTVVEEQGVRIGNEELINYRMEHPLPGLPRKAASADLPRIMDIIRQAQAQMYARGSLQWQNGYPSREHIESDIRHGYGYVLCDGDRITAYAAVVFDGEPAYAALRGKWLSQSDYVVVHRLAVADEAKGRGIATAFMLRIEALARLRGVPSVRVDTNFDNTPMLHALEKLNFVRCGEIDYEGAPRIAFEKLLG